MSNTTYIGSALPRVDGPLKVTGQARYAGEFMPSDLAYGYVVASSVARGSIVRLDTTTALAVPGVLAVFTHENLPEYLKQNSDYSDPIAPPGQPFRPLYNDRILYSGQPIALVVAETFELARFAAGLIEVDYATEDFRADMADHLDQATTEDVPDPPGDRGDAAAAYAESVHRVDATYVQPRHYHNPMEPHATVVEWHDSGALTVYDKIQGVASSQQYVCGVFGLDKVQVRVKSPFVGGAFGSGLRPQYQLFMAVLAATELKRSVQVTMTRRQMFSFGHRPKNIQRMQLSTDAVGMLTSIRHQSFGETSQFERFSEDIVLWSGLMYQCANVGMDYQLVPVDAYTPMDMRAPGGVTAMFALECAMDEMAIAAGQDPLDFRLLNYAEHDQNADLPFSSKELRACYRQCADRFGWADRPSQPRSRRAGHRLIGYGMATGVWEAGQQKASAEATLYRDGSLTVRSATADIGTGTYTVMSQIAADSFGIDLDRVTFELGDSTLPRSPIEGGSWTVASVGSAVRAACIALQDKIIHLAKKTYPDRYEDRGNEDFVFAAGQLSVDRKFPLQHTDLLATHDLAFIEARGKAGPSKERKDYATYAHACVMVEVQVDEALGTIRVPRVVNASAAGKIINPKTAENQLLGATVWGIGMALHEEGLVDKQLGRVMNTNLAEYHLPVHADVQDIEIIFVEERDDIVNPLGAKGVGELGIVGVASAIANAIYNATGKRIRELPITLDKLL